VYRIRVHHHIDATPAKKHHERAAHRHERAAACWENRGERTRAAEERRNAQKERAMVELARDRVRLDRNRHTTRPTQGAGELGEDRQVGMEPDAIQSAHAER
jgi:hypothetical protein